MPLLNIATATELIHRAICQERCAYRGEPACWSMEGLAWPNPECDEPGCHAEASAAIVALQNGGFI